MISALILASLLSIQDPSNDANGNGSLTPPTSLSHVANALDITNFSIPKENKLTIELEFASLANPHERPLGFSFPIVELYIHDDSLSGGSNELLPGSGMNLAKQDLWHYAIKLNGDSVQLYDARSGQAELSLQTVAIEQLNNKLTLTTSLSRPNNLTAYGVVGYYSPFNETGWQALTPYPSAWTYSSSEQLLPVIDVIAMGDAAQKQALERGVLPAIGTSVAPNYWLFVMIAGLGLAIFGVAMRFFRKKQEVIVKPVTVKPEPNEAFEAFLALGNDSASPAKDKDKGSSGVLKDRLQAAISTAPDLTSEPIPNQESSEQEEFELFVAPTPSEIDFSEPLSNESEAKEPNLEASDGTEAKVEKASNSDNKTDPQEKIKAPIIKLEKADVPFPAESAWLDDEDDSVWHEEPN